MLSEEDKSFLMALHKLTAWNNAVHRSTCIARVPPAEAGI
jgi:hypothetical protein